MAVALSQTQHAPLAAGKHPAATRGDACVKEIDDLDLAPVDNLLDAMAAASTNGNPPFCNEDLIPILQSVQKVYGYLPANALRRVSRRTGIAESHIQGVASFYGQFYRKPRGRHTVTVCCGTACHVRGGKKLLETIKETLGIGPGETTPDAKITLEAAACLGACALAPLMVVDDKYHGKMIQGAIEKLAGLTSQEDRA